MTNKYCVNPDLIECKDCGYLSDKEIEFDDKGLCKKCRG